MENTQKAVELYLKAVKDHVKMGRSPEIKKAFELLRKLDEAKDAGIENDLILLISRFHSNEKDKDDDIIDRSEYRREVAKIRIALLNTVDNIPDKLELNAQVAGLKGWDFEVPDDVHLEKIIGKVSNLYKISWLENAIQAAKSVCRIVCNDGSKGTGFLIEGNYLITNNHVLPNESMAAGAEIEFNFEENVAGERKQKVTYKLDSSDFITSHHSKLDVTRVKVLENPDAEPLSSWGYLNVTNNKIPAKDSAVTIIQHPSGRDKHIALTANKVIVVQEGRVLYTTDTEGGSSGSPVFDKDWNVVALHHAGRLLDRGGMKIKATGERVSANEGIIFKHINDFLRENGGATGNNTPAIDTPAPASSESTAVKPEPVATPPSPAPEKEEPPVAEPTTTDTSSTGLQVFVMSEQRKDKANLAKLMAQLKPLAGGEKNVAIIDMHEGRTFGKQKERWEKAIDSAACILCLITPSFFKTRDKLADLAKYGEEKGKTIIPILVTPTDEYESSFLYDFEPLPMSGDFIASLEDGDAAYVEIGEAVKGFLDTL